MSECPAHRYFLRIIVAVSDKDIFSIENLIGSHREALDKIADYLIRRETITGKEFMKIFHAVERGIEIPENLDDLVIPEEKQNTVTLDKPEIQ